MAQDSEKSLLPDAWSLQFLSMALSSVDLLLVNRITLELYRALNPEEHIQATLRALDELVPCTLVAWNEFSMATRELRLVTRPPMKPEEESRVKAISLYAHQSPFPSYYAASGDRSWRMIVDFMPIEEFQKTDFCVRGLDSWGPHQISCVLTSFNEDVKALTLNRLHTGFTERDRAVLNLLHPHLSLSHYNSHAFDQAHRSLRELKAVVETAPAGYAFVGQSGRIEWSTAKARKLWDQFFIGQARDDAGVPITILRWVRSQLSRAAPDAAAGSEPLIDTVSCGERLETRLIPGPLGGWILTSESHPVEIRPRFKELPQLSIRENEVLRWMTEGKRNSEIAKILGISHRTVEKHVESILVSLGVENRATAIISAMGMCAAMSGKT